MLKIIALLFLTVFIKINTVFAKEINVKNQIYTAELVVQTPQPYTLSDKTKEGIELLKKSLPLKYETRTTKLKNGKKVTDLINKQIILAILNTTTGETFEKRIWVSENDVKNFKKTSIVTFKSADDVDLNVQPKQWNSFNTFYEVIDRPEMIVVANKYLIESIYLGNLPEKSKNRYSEIIYVPYSLSLHQPEIIAAGKDYLAKSIDLAFEQLDKKSVQSKSIFTQLATSVVTEDFIKNIILVEHVDPDLFSVSDDGGRELSERVLAIIGANENHAYRYTGSPAGASGLAQFIKSTYQIIVSKYPEADLIKDYNLGMADHVNAIQAMVLFFDLYRQEMASKITKPEVISQLGITEEMLAAAYNGGPNRVVKSVNKYGLAWLSQQLDLPSTKRIFKSETLKYLEKLNSIRGLSIF